MNSGYVRMWFRKSHHVWLVVYLPLWKIWVKVSWDMLRWWNSHVPNQMSYPSSNAMVPPNTQWNLGFHHGSITFPIDLALGPDQLAPWSVSLFQAKRNALGMLRYAKYLGFLKVFGKMFIRCFSYIICVYGGVRKCGYPNNWLVYFMENPKIKWMINLVVPLF